MDVLWQTCLTTHDVRSALTKLPKGLDGIYHRCLQLLESEEGSRVYATKILYFASHATRPLQVPELREAIAFDVGDKSWEDGKIPYLLNIPGCCANLAVLDPTDLCVRLAHPSVKTFLKKCPPIYWYNGSNGSEFYSETYFGSICVSYLSFSNFQLALDKPSALKTIVPSSVPQTVLGSLPFGGLFSKAIGSSSFRSQLPATLSTGVIRSDTNRSRRKIKTYHFLQYAKTSWPHHTRNFDMKDPGMQLRGIDIWMTFSALALRPNEAWDLHPWLVPGQSSTSHMFGLWSFAILNDHRAFFHVIKHDKEALRMAKGFCNLPLAGSELIALHVLVRRPDSPWEWLLDYLDAYWNFGKRDTDQNIALHHACEVGNLHMVKVLVSRLPVRAMLNIKNVRGETPLWTSSATGRTDVLKLLLQNRGNAETNRRAMVARDNNSHALYGGANSDGITALGIASRNGHHETVRYLLAKRYRDIQTPSEKTKVAEFINLRAADGKTALEYALECGDEAMAAYLLGVGARFQTEDARALWMDWRARDSLSSDELKGELREWLNDIARLDDLRFVRFLMLNGADPVWAWNLSIIDQNSRVFDMLSSEMFGNRPPISLDTTNVIYTSVTMSVASGRNIFALDSKDAEIVNCARSSSPSDVVSTSDLDLANSHSFVFESTGFRDPPDVKVIVSRKYVVLGDRELVLPGAFNLIFTIAHQGTLLAFTLAKDIRRSKYHNIEIVFSGRNSSPGMFYRTIFYGDLYAGYDLHRGSHVVNSGND